MVKLHYRIMNIVVLLVLIFFISCISIGYSALNASVTISGDLQYESANKLYNIIAKSSKGLDSNLDLGADSTVATSGVYQLSGYNNPPIYYYHGIVSNNNVLFAKFCWKIVRTSENKGIKLIYNGKPSSNGSCNNTGTDTQIGESVFNDFTALAAVGYVYDADDLDNLNIYYYTNVKDSVIKVFVETWYKNNMTNYTKMLEDPDWIIDNDYTCSRYDSSYTNCEYYEFGAINKFKPSSYFSVNGHNKYPVGLLTSGEVYIAGLDLDMTDGDMTYLAGSNNWWTMSPSSYFASMSAPIVVSRYDGLNAPTIISDKIGVRPVVSLAPETIISSGDGSVNKPYQILTD